MLSFLIVSVDLYDWLFVAYILTRPARKSIDFFKKKNIIIIFCGIILFLWNINKSTHVELDDCINHRNQYYTCRL